MNKTRVGMVGLGLVSTPHLKGYEWQRADGSARLRLPDINMNVIPLHCASGKKRA
jgi:hypothetical protein